jgi:hypothetical protein
MTADAVEAMLPTAAALAVAVCDYDQDAVAAVLLPLDQAALYALAIALAHLAGPNAAQQHLDLELPVDVIAQAITTAGRLFCADPTLIRFGYRTQPHLDARHVAIHAAHLCGISYAGIGRALGQDHTTAMNACARVGESPRLRRIALRVATECGWNRNAQEATPDMPFLNLDDNFADHPKVDGALRRSVPAARRGDALRRQAHDRRLHPSHPRPPPHPHLQTALPGRADGVRPLEAGGHGAT